jgi:hypothetical protein
MTQEFDAKSRDNQSPAHVPGVTVSVSRRSFLMNTVVFLPIAAAVPIASPPIANESYADSVLLDLGHKFDAAVARLVEAYAAQTEIEDDFWQEVGRRRRWPAKQRDWTSADAKRFWARKKKIE